MNLHKLFLGAVLALNAFPAFSSGGWTGGGGDPKRFYFLDGKQLAAEIVRRIDNNSIPLNSDPVTRAWILKNKDLLGADITNSEHQWLQPAHDKQPTCAWTQFQSKAVISLSYQACISVGSKEEAAKVLIHESAHHLGVRNEILADKIAQAVFGAWENLLVREVPFCPNTQNITAELLVGRWKPDLPLGERMQISQSSYEKWFQVETFTFTNESGFAKVFPGVGKCAYLAGLFSIRWKDGRTDRSPYILVQENGNPMIYFDEKFERDGGGVDRISDLHRGYKMVGKGGTRSGDILFVGGDHNNQPLFPMLRDL